MKSILTFAMLIFVFGISSTSFAVNYCGGTINGGDGRPWPWGNEIRLPWKTVQGVWQTVSGDCKNQFVFKVSNLGSETIVRITQYDPYTCKVVGKGAGYLDENRVIVAQMNQNGVTYNMSIHAFSETDLLESIEPFPRKVYQSSEPRSLEKSARVLKVINLFPTGRWYDRSSYEISKIDTSVTMICQ